METLKKTIIAAMLMISFLEFSASAEKRGIETIKNDTPSAASSQVVIIRDTLHIDNKIVYETLIMESARSTQFRMVVHEWGGFFYFMNDKSITRDIYRLILGKHIPEVNGLNGDDQNWYMANNDDISAVLINDTIVNESRVVIEVFLKERGKLSQFKHIVHNWGEEYFFMNDKPITGDYYRNLLSMYIPKEN